VRLVVTREDYFAPALDVLAARGHGPLTIGLLCRTIGVTTGSFYHYFGSWDAFVDELLRHWEREKTQRPVAVASAETDPITRVRTIKKLTLALPHDAETAIRAWAHVNPAVAVVQARVDDERLASIRAAIVPLVGRNRRTERLAVMGMTLLVGHQQWRTPVDVRELARLLDDYEDLILANATVAVG
jgi:AcrR family transcriptional regulator